jgi:integrase
MIPTPPQDDLLDAFIRRLRDYGRSERGVTAYLYALNATLHAAHRLSGRSLSSVELFQDLSLLGHALIDDRSLNGALLSKWTLAQRRSAIRSFATLMRPELSAQLDEEPLAVIDRALRMVAERLGSGYRLSGGLPRRRGGFTPSVKELARVMEVLGREPGYTGLRHRAFFGILRLTGCRINALRVLDGTDCLVLPSGRIRIYLGEKGRKEEREVELDEKTARALQAYVDAFNRTRIGDNDRIALGQVGAIWRGATGRQWGYAALLTRLRAACAEAGMPPMTPHAFRRAFASDAAGYLPRQDVARAGGWDRLERLDNHYIQANMARTWEKLAPTENVGIPAKEGVVDNGAPSRNLQSIH